MPQKKKLTPRQQKRQDRNDYLMKNYKISIVEYEQKLKEQRGMCAICERPPVTRSLHVDHNHTTGKVRGLLCHNCNYGLSRFFKEDIHSLNRAVAYLEKYNDLKNDLKKEEVK